MLAIATELYTAMPTSTAAASGVERIACARFDAAAK
jgi:hypothetical protein